MDWLLNHPQVLFAIAIAIAAILQKLKQSGRGKTAGEAPAMDPQEAERTRRIQEEIRRRIMERRGLAPAAPPPAAEEEAPAFPEAPPMIEEVRPVVVAPPVWVPMEAAPAPDYSSEAEQQRQMLQRFHQLELAEREHTGTGPAAAGGLVITTPVSAPASGLLAMLRNPAGLRQAVVLREILGPPVGMR
jgi:hypothetical protein